MATINTATTNFDQTVTALVLSRIAENLRREVKYLVPGSYLLGNLIPGTNLIRHISYGDLAVTSAVYAADGTPPWLEEGVAPAEEAITIGYDQFGVNEAGRLVAISNRALDFNPHNLYAVAAERVAFNMLATVDGIVAATVQAITATTTNGHAAAALTTSDYLSADLVRLQVSALRAGHVPSFGGEYMAFAHPYALHDLMGDDKWMDVTRYADPDRRVNGEVGKIWGCRFIDTTVGTWVNNTGGGSNNLPVYSTLFFGREFFAFGDFGSIQSYMVRPGNDHSDPLAQKALIGWRGYIGAKVLSTLGTRARRLVHAGSVAGAAPTP